MQTHVDCKNNVSLIVELFIDFSVIVFMGEGTDLIRFKHGFKFLICFMFRFCM